MPILTLENLVYLNCDKSGYTECYISYWIWRSLPFLLIVIGIVGNTLNIVVLSRKQLRKRSTCVFLIFLSVTDMLTLCSGPLVQVLRNAFGLDFYTWSTFSCTVTEWVVYTSGMTSCWLITLVTLERTLVTLFPVKAKPHMTARNALIASFTVVVFICLHNGHLFNANILTEINAKNETKSESLKSCSLRSGGYTEFYNNIWSLMILFTGSLIPIIIIVTGNTIIGISLIKLRKARRHIHPVHGISTSTGTNRMQQRRERFGTNIMFVLCGVYIFTTTPFSIYLVLTEFNKEVDEHTLATEQLIHIIMKCLIWSNFSFNFLLYFMTSSLFRTECKNILASVRKTILTFTGRSVVQPVNNI